MNLMTWLQHGAEWAWHTSLAVAIPGLVLLALGRWRGFSARWRMLLAAALFLRLLLPVVPEFSWRPALSYEKALSTKSTAAVVDEVATLSGSALEETPVIGAVPVHAGLQHTIAWGNILAVIWAFGVLSVAAWVVGSEVILRRWISRQAVTPDAEIQRLLRECCERMGIRRRIGLAELSRISTAAVWGWLRPVVLVPANLLDTHTHDEIRGILLHELAHVRRGDVLWSWLGLMACALHWFNPIVWLALRRFHADRELDCDRLALEKLTPPQRNAYAPALFKTLQTPVLAAPATLVPFFRHRHEIHNRILTIMKPSKSLIASLAALLVIPGLSLLSLTSAGADEEKIAPRDGEIKKPGPRDGDQPKKGPRDGETKKSNPRDGAAKTPPENAYYAHKLRLINFPRVSFKDARVEEAVEFLRIKSREYDIIERDPTRKGVNLIIKPGISPSNARISIELNDVPMSEALKYIAELAGMKYTIEPYAVVLTPASDTSAEQAKATGIRDGEGERKTGAHDGEMKKEGARDGEGKKSALRDGEGKKTGPRDGETKKTGARDGEARKEGLRDGEGAKRDAHDGDTAAKTADGEAVVLRLIDKGENVSIGGKTIPLGKLRGYFSQQGKGMSLVVKGDPDVPYKAVSEVLDAARDNGITSLSLAASDEDGGETKNSSKER